MGNLKSKALGTIGGNVGPAQSIPVTGNEKPWNSDSFAPPPMAPNPNSIDHPKPAPKDKKRKSTANKWADRQLGVIEDEGY